MGAVTGMQSTDVRFRANRTLSRHRPRAEFDPQPSCPAQDFRSARRLNAPGWEELGQLPFPFLEGTPLRGRTYAGSLEGIVALQAGILPGPPGPLVSALE